MTVVASAQMSEHNALRLTERIRSLAVTAKEQLEKLQHLLAEARDGEAWRTLGYRSWPDYLSDVMGDQPLRLPRDERQQIVGYLAGEGMSSRAIAPIVGTTHATVQQDVKRAGRNLPAEPVEDFVTDQVDLDAEEPTRPEPPKVTGIDGKQYTRPEPKPEVRESPSGATNTTGAERNRVQQESEARGLARTLTTLSAFDIAERREQYREAWSAQPYVRAAAEKFYTPTQLRKCAKNLEIFADELEQTNA